MDELAKERAALGRTVLAITFEEVEIIRLDGSKETFDLPVSLEREKMGSMSVGGVRAVPYYDLNALPDAKTIREVKGDWFTVAVTHPE